MAFNDEPLQGNTHISKIQRGGFLLPSGEKVSLKATDEGPRGDGRAAVTATTESHVGPSSDPFGATFSPEGRRKRAVLTNEMRPSFGDPA